MRKKKRKKKCFVTYVLVAFHMTPLKFKLQNYYPPEILLSWCIRAVGNFSVCKQTFSTYENKPVERLSCLYIQQCARMDAICKESLWKIYNFVRSHQIFLSTDALAPNFLVYRGENNTPALTLKCCCLPGKYKKTYNKTGNFFCFDHQRNFCHFF